MPKNILIIEDNKDIAKLVEMHLKDEGHATTLAFDGTKGLEVALSRSFDLIILDIMLPGVDGLEICRRVRAMSPATPILMLTARSTELDRVLGLELGADDYLTKPFSIRELVARVKALFRRAGTQGAGASPGENTVIRVGELVIDVDKRRVLLKDKEVSLTAKEFDLLLRFAQRPGRVYTRMELLNSVWGYGYEGYEHTVNSHINRLRNKIEEDPSRPRHILSVRGVGYKFAEASDLGKEHV
jgi:DNA-binding response OmpR family regulator